MKLRTIYDIVLITFWLSMSTWNLYNHPGKNIPLNIFGIFFAGVLFGPYFERWVKGDRNRNPGVSPGN